MHTRAERQEIVTKINNHEKTDNKFGIIAEPILDFPLGQVIPCNMHCVMGIMKKLVRLPHSYFYPLPSTHLHSCHPRLQLFDACLSFDPFTHCDICCCCCVCEYHSSSCWPSM